MLVLHNNILSGCFVNCQHPVKTFRLSSCTLSEFVYMIVYIAISYVFLCYTGREREKEKDRERERERERQGERKERERGRKS